MKYTASHLSEGNHIFATEIEVQDSGLTVKVPGLFNGSSQFIDFKNIASVEIDSPLIGYSTLCFRGAGTDIKAHGFTKTEVEEIKNAIEKGKSR
jgi:hypothetical protein